MKCGVSYEAWTFLQSLLIIKVVLGVEKHWLPNLEWETAENWIGKRIPELDSYVTFPLDMRHAVGIGKSIDLRLSGIDLPRSGSLVLPRNGKLQLSEAGKSAKKISQWSRSGHLFWADPQNWGGSSIAAPHLEQVPCRQDNIVLPRKNQTFSVLLPMKNIEVKSVRMMDEKQPYRAWQWADMVHSREFEKGIFTVKYVGYSCKECPCQDDPNGYYLEEICAIERPKCGFTPCEYPIWVEGHCCRYCGGRLSLTNKVPLSMVQVLTDEALERYAEKLAWHVRPTWNGAIEVLIKKKLDYSEIDILEATEDAKRALQSMKIEVFSAEVTGAAVQDNRMAITLVPFLGMPMIVLLLLFLFFLYFGYSYRHFLLGFSEIFSSIRDGIRADKTQGSKPFGFARFENSAESNVQIANIANEPNLEDNEAEGNDPSSGGRFENPLYRSRRKGRKEDEEVLNMEAPLSLSTLKRKVDDQIEEADLDTDQ
ncbi:protein amnionless-like [Bombus impatiens]|uniref:Protein amnionless n=1 Tax=Bombus impatiens TaxID=132113 RepID=A0A6P8LE74_BOMIM|nr:protein amnionless-like [Bombus impatiens]XP_033176872.1 protein amnionless-like [Bombus impatiens]